MKFITLRGAYNYFTYSNSVVTAISCYPSIDVAWGYNESRTIPYGYQKIAIPQINTLNFFYPNSGYFARVSEDTIIEFNNPLDYSESIPVFNNYNIFTYPYEERSLTLYSDFIKIATGTLNPNNNIAISYIPTLPSSLNRLQFLSSLSGYFMQAKTPFVILGPTQTPTPTKVS